MARSSKMGFTLMELLVLIAMLSIVALLGKSIGEKCADRKLQSGTLVRCATTNVVTTTNVVYTLRSIPKPEAVREY